MSIGLKIKELRKLNKLTQVDLAKKSNISRSYLADIERDRYNPSIDTLTNIAKSLNVSLSKLVNDEDSTNEDSSEQNIEFNVPKEYADKYKVTSRDKKQYFEETKKATEAFFMNDEFNEETKKEMLDLMSELFWKAKAMNKRKK